MIKFNKLLLPTDFSSAVLHALGYAISLATEHEASIFPMYLFQTIYLSVELPHNTLTQRVQRTNRFFPDPQYRSEQILKR